MRNFRSSPRTAGAIAGLLLLVACAGDPPPVPVSRGGGTLRIDAPQLGQFRSFDPVRVTDINSSSIAGALYEGLIGYAPGSAGRFASALAASWEVSPDLRAWTFHLREGVRFHDDPCFEGGRGRVVTSGDVRYSLLRFLRGAEGAPLSLRSHVLGAEAFVRGDADDVTGLETPDPRTVIIRLERPSTAFLHAMATSAGWVVPREAVERYGGTFGLHPVGTGPFRFASWNSTTLVLVRNDHYWKIDDEGAALPYLDSLVMERSSFGGHRRTALSDLLDGSLHLLYFTGELPWEESTSLSDFLAERGVRTVRTPKLNTIFFGFQLEADGPWGRLPGLRYAIAHAVRRPDAGELLIPAGGLVPPGLCGEDSIPPMEQDLDAAREFLAQAGYPGGSGLPVLELGILGRSEYFVESFLAPLTEIGIRTELKIAPWDTHWDALDRGDYQLFRDGWIADYADAENFLALFQSGAPSNHTRYANPAFDRLLERYRALPADDPDRAVTCAKLEEILRRDCPAVFLYHERSVYFVSGDVQGIDASINPFERKFYELVWLAPEAR